MGNFFDTHAIAPTRFNSVCPSVKWPCGPSRFVWGPGRTGPRSYYAETFLEGSDFRHGLLSYARQKTRLAADVVRNPIGAALQLGTPKNVVRRAVAFVKEDASEYRVNPNKVALIGESAGEQFTSMAALRPDPQGAVQGVVAFYTPSDLKHSRLSASSFPDFLGRQPTFRANRDCWATPRYPTESNGC
jgi:hypothetical protein